MGKIARISVGYSDCWIMFILWLRCVIVYVDVVLFRYINFLHITYNTIICSSFISPSIYSICLCVESTTYRERVCMWRWWWWRRWFLLLVIFSITQFQSCFYSLISIVLFSLCLCLVRVFHSSLSIHAARKQKKKTFALPAKVWQLSGKRK